MTILEKMPETKWYHGRVWVLIMLFLILGPVGFPLLWKSPHFTKTWKLILTALTLLYTAWILTVFVDVLQTSTRSLSSMGLG